MTNANMKLVVLNVVLPDKLETPGQRLEGGEFIVPRVVQLSKLNDELNGIILLFCSMIKLHASVADYAKKVPSSGRCIYYNRL
jgi:hypothetical protein